jgi:hypothetical protein
VQITLQRSVSKHQDVKKKEEEAVKKAQLEVKFKEEIQYHEPKEEPKRDETDDEEDPDEPDDDDDDEEDEERERYLRSKQLAGKR